MWHRWTIKSPDFAHQRYHVSIYRLIPFVFRFLIFSNTRLYTHLFSIIRLYFALSASRICFRVAVSRSDKLNKLNWFHSGWLLLNGRQTMNLMLIGFPARYSKRRVCVRLLNTPVRYSQHSFRNIIVVKKRRIYNVKLCYSTSAPYSQFNHLTSTL
jgi:hypothetical protein